MSDQEAWFYFYDQQCNLFMLMYGRGPFSAVIYSIPSYGWAIFKLLFSLLQPGQVKV